MKKSRTIKYYEVNGRSLTAAGWAKYLGITRQAMYQRLSKADSRESLIEALSSPDIQGRKLARPNPVRKGIPTEVQTKINPNDANVIHPDKVILETYTYTPKG